MFPRLNIEQLTDAVRDAPYFVRGFSDGTLPSRNQQQKAKHMQDISEKIRASYSAEEDDGLAGPGIEVAAAPSADFTLMPQHGGGHTAAVGGISFPIMPPKQLDPIVPVSSAIGTRGLQGKDLQCAKIDAIPDGDELLQWYVLLSPREEKGVAGPLNVQQVKHLYKIGEVTDQTWAWCEGDNDWIRVAQQYSLRPKLLQMPMLPPRMGKYNAERSVFDPIAEPPTAADLQRAVELKGFDVHRFCSQCGGMAVAHIPHYSEQVPDLYKNRVEVGTTSDASEILPGLLWVGNVTAVRQRHLLRLGITLAINCAAEMHSPKERPPAYRCKSAPMQEAPTGDFTDAEVHALHELFERVYDWVEYHRMYPELAVKSDPAQGEWRGATNKYGIPIRPPDQRPIRKPKEDEKPLFAPRVLLWSRLGADRPCAVAASYLIKHYGITLARALDIISENRLDAKVSMPHMKVLKAWGEKYTLGLLLCRDCQLITKQNTINVKDHKSNSSNKDSKKPKGKPENLQQQQQQQQQGLRGGAGGDGAKPELLTSAAQQARSGDPQLEESYDTFAQLMQKNFPRLLVGREGEARLLFHAPEYLKKVAMPDFRTTQFQWVGLLDLELTGRRLSDITLAVFFQMLAGNGLTKQLRMLKLAGNQVAHLALKALLEAYFPRDYGDDDEYLFDPETAAMDIRDNCELQLLDLSNNKIDEFGTQYLVYFLKQCNSLTALDLSHNGLTDWLCCDIVNCIARPPESFDDIEERSNADGRYGFVSDDRFISQMRAHNYSITSLNLSYNQQLGDNGAAALTNMVKHNAVLRSLHLDMAQAVSPASWKRFSHAVRLYNSVLQVFSVADTVLTVKTAALLGRMLDGSNCAINTLIFSNCSLKHQHIAAMVPHLLNAEHLTNLNLSSNKITDKAAESLQQLLHGKKSDSTMQMLPLLKRIDLSNCGFQSKGCALLMKGLQERNAEHLKSIDLSGNEIGCDNREFMAALSTLRAQELHMNRCCLRSKGAAALFNLLSGARSGENDTCSNSISSEGNVETVPDEVGDGVKEMVKADKTVEIRLELCNSLKACYLTDNEISDSVYKALGRFLEHNYTMEVLDLGFNALTDLYADYLHESQKVVSEMQLEKKVFALTVNLVGNQCDPYMLEAPGLARAKETFMFGIQRNAADSANQGFSHVAGVARGNYLARKGVNDQYRAFFPPKTINQLN